MAASHEPETIHECYPCHARASRTSEMSKSSPSPSSRAADRLASKLPVESHVHWGRTTYRSTLDSDE